MKKFLVAAIFGLAGLAAFAGTCTITHMSIVQTDGSHMTIGGQVDNNSGADILQHNILVAFLDSGMNLVETQSVPGCLRSAQNGHSDFFSATSTHAASSITSSVGLARIAFDSTFRVGTTSSQDVTISEVVASRSTTTLTVTGKVTNNSSTKLIAPNACIVVRTSAGNVLITDTDTSMSDLSHNAFDTFSVTITVPDDSSADNVDVWVDGLDSSGNPTTPESDIDTVVNEGGTADHLSFTTQPVGGVIINTNFTTMPVVKILDVNGDVVASGTDSDLTVTLGVKAGTAPAGTTVTCDDNTLNAVAGVAAFTNCKVNHADPNIQLTATASGTTSADSSTFAINPGAATTLAFTPNPSGVSSNTAFTAVVSVHDANGDTVWTGTGSTTNITVSKATGTSALAGCVAAVAPVAGVATFSNCTLAISGSYTLGATNGTQTGTSGSFLVSPGAAATLAFTQQPASTSTGVLTTQPIVTVVDAAGNAVTTGVPTLTLTSGTAALSGCAGVNAAGTVTYSGCSISTSGAKTLTATLGSATIASNSFTIP